ncbi:MAG: hypothetical protein V1733_04635, partial [bacterium]
MMVCILVILSLTAWPAGDTVTVTRTDRTLSISFQPQNQSISANINAILLQLAASRDVNPKKLQIRVNFSEELEIHHFPEKNPVVILRIQEVSVAGSERYRGFSIGDVLVPDRMSCNLNLVSVPDSVILRQYRLLNLDMAQLVVGYTSVDIPMVEPEKLAVTLSDFTFSYSGEELSRFTEKLCLINDYYAASALADTLLSQVEGYDPKSVPGDYILLMEVDKLVKMLEEKNFSGRLELPGYDPQDYQKNFSALFRFSRSASMTFEQQLPGQASVNWDGNLDVLADQYIRHLLKYIFHSLLLNGIRGSIYEEYLTRYFEVPAFEDDRTIFLTLVQKMFPDLTTDSAAVLVSRTIWDAYLQKTSDLINRSSFTEALKLLKNADSFRSHTPYLVNAPGADSLVSLAVRGVYASYLGIAESCIDLQKFQLAENYITKAGEYKQNYTGLLPSDTLLQRIFRKLFNRTLSGCDYLLSGNQYLEALECYQLFELSYPPDMVSYVSDYLHSKRNQALRGLFTEQAELVASRLRLDDTDSALACYDRACGFQTLIPDDPEALRA